MAFPPTPPSFPTVFAATPSVPTYISSHCATVCCLPPSATARCHPQAEMFDRESIYLASEEVYALQRQLQAESQQLLDDLVQAASREGPENLQVECSSEEGDPREVILSEAKRVAADLIVVGSRGLGAVGRCELRDWCSPLSLPCLFMGAAQHAWFF
ncbi:unnamed protein product [Closterium sp. NIES-64]|nr:unnamed protein product [Closterium sp. NIES-64]